MKRFILVLMLLMLPTMAFGYEYFEDQAMFTVYENDDHEYGSSLFLPIEDVRAIETIRSPHLGIKIIFNSGYSTEMEAKTSAQALRMYLYAYKDFKDYYHWSNEYTQKIIKQNNKANFTTVTQE